GRGDAAPQDAPVPARRAFLRVECLADRGGNAAGGDQQGALMGPGRLACRLVDEISADAAGALGPVVEMMAGENVRRAEPFGRGVEQDLLQRAAVDRELRPFVARLGAARLAPDRLAALGEIG